jgi:hypothetical protein
MSGYWKRQKEGIVESTGKKEEDAIKGYATPSIIKEEKTRECVKSVHIFPLLFRQSSASGSVVEMEEAGSLLWRMGGGGCGEWNWWRRGGEK